jgi:FkbM family methyltransferase
MELLISEEERALQGRFIRDGGVVFDVGANVGEWTITLLNIHPNAKVYAFEPGGRAFNSLLSAVGDSVKDGRAVCNPMALGEHVGVAEFFDYSKEHSLNTLHRRSSVESALGLPPPARRPVPITTLDAYCRGVGIRHIDFLKIDVEGHERAVLRGAQGLLDRRAIDYLQIEYGGTYVDAGTTLSEVFDLVTGAGYAFYRLVANGLIHIPSFFPALEDYQYALYLAVSPRLACQLRDGPREMFDYRALFLRHQVQPRGLIHVGAHEGEEIAKYRGAGVERVLFIEGDPATFSRLKQNLGAESDVLCLQQLVSDQPGKVPFHRMTMAQSNSLLPLKMHSQLYPSITEAETIELSTNTLDDTLNSAGIPKTDYNVLVIDVQGAEYKVLLGASETLASIDAVITEVNYAELYAGCALIHDLDDLLDRHGFVRVEETCPFDPTWGDALYIRRPRISMVTLGSNGRFANQLFQYHFLRMAADARGGLVETPPWIGEALFDLPARRPGGAYLQVIQPQPPSSPQDLISQIAKHRDVDLWGYFQYHTKSWSDRRDSFRSLFAPRAEFARVLNHAIASARGGKRTFVACHLRRGDYGYGPFFVAPESWYVEFLDDIWPHLDSPLLYIASDNLDAVLPAFQRFSPVTERELGVDLGVAQMYVDFYVQSQADIQMISNSSYSFAAALLNKGGRVFVRPERDRGRMVPFDPWNCDVLWHCD